MLDGRPFRLCLTLGALAELEDALGVDDLASIGARFADGRVRARDLLHVLVAGLRGGGHDVSVDDVARMRVEGGVGAQARLCAALLAAAFGSER